MGKQKIYMSVTDEMREFLESSKTTIPNCIEIDELYTAVVSHNQTKSNFVNINDLLKNSKIMYRRTEGTGGEKFSELEIMRRNAEERKYQKSISNIKLGGKSVTGASSDVKSASESLSFASHFILAFASSFLLGYYFAEYALSVTDESYKYIAGGAASFLTLIIESLLFIIREEKRSKVDKRCSLVRKSPIRQSIEQTGDGESSIVAKEESQEESVIRSRKRR